MDKRSRQQFRATIKCADVHYGPCLELDHQLRFGDLREYSTDGDHQYQSRLWTRSQPHGHGDGHGSALPVDMGKRGRAARLVLRPSAPWADLFTPSPIWRTLKRFTHQSHTVTECTRSFGGWACPSLMSRGLVKSIR